MPKLFPFQEVGADFLASKRTALLADEQRLGKAVQAIVACDRVGANSVLVVCRGVARSNWAEEFRRWSKRGWDISVAFGRDFELPKKLPGVLIVSYELLSEVLQRDVRFDVAIIDEAQYVKEPTAKRTKLVYGRDHLPARAGRFWALTGTPTPNHAAELWTLLFTFGCTKLSYWQFAEKFCIVVSNGYGTQITGTNLAAVEELQGLMKDKVLRRTTDEVGVQLPKISFSVQTVPPGPVNLRITSSWWKYVIPHDRTAEFAALLEAELGVVNGIVGDGDLTDEALEALKASSKSISTLRRYTALQKLEPSCELIANELDSGAYQKCVIFAHHRDCINGAAEYLHKFHPVTMYGGSNPIKVEKNIRNFQNPKHKCRVFIGQISAAGTSISLSAANHIFFLEESFVPGDNMQAAMRCGGINQPNPIFVRTFCLENSFDKRVQQILMRKMNEISKIYAKVPTLDDLA